MQHHLSIDIETYSSADLAKSGVYRYTEAPDFTILIFAYSFNNNPVHVIDLANGESLPGAVVQALTDPNVLKTAHNAAFERTCISAYLKGLPMPADQWDCTMVKCAMMGLPLALGFVAKVLQLEEQKNTEGKALIKYFSCPCKPTKTNGERTRNDILVINKNIANLKATQSQFEWDSKEFDSYQKQIEKLQIDVAKWDRYKEYCKQDVVTEKAIRTKLHWFNITDSEKKLWRLDQKINDTGVLLDPVLVQNAIRLDLTNKALLTERAIKLTGLDNPNSTAQLKAWIGQETGEEVKSLSKETIPGLLENSDCDILTKVLQIRQEMSKTSVKKYQAISEAVCSDGRVRGLLQFYGANRTGRWAGRLVQVQNLPQNHLKDLDLARQLVKENDLDMLEMCFGNVPDTLSQLIRTAFIPKEGHTFIVADFSAIEARVIAWLADEKWRLDVFNSHGKIYEASGAAMFKVPIEEVTKGSLLRQKAKIAELALGYQGGVGALEKMGAAKMGVQADELQGLVDAWRNANQNIVRLWKEIGVAAIKAVTERTSIVCRHGVTFIGKSNRLAIKLPSGRELNYLYPKMGKNRFDSDSLTYEGMNQTTKQWEVQETYGGKLTENIVQAIARDCLAYAMMKINEVGWPIVMHVHDEVVIDLPEGFDPSYQLGEVCRVMGEPIPWAKGLPLRADGYVTDYYRKD